VLKKIIFFSKHFIVFYEIIFFLLLVPKKKSHDVFEDCLLETQELTWLMREDIKNLSKQCYDCRLAGEENTRTSDGKRGVFPLCRVPMVRPQDPATDKTGFTASVSFSCI